MGLVLAEMSFDLDVAPSLLVELGTIPFHLKQIFPSTIWIQCFSKTCLVEFRAKNPVTTAQGIDKRDVDLTIYTNNLCVQSTV